MALVGPEGEELASGLDCADTDRLGYFSEVLGFNTNRTVYPGYSWIVEEVLAWSSREGMVKCYKSHLKPVGEDRSFEVWLQTADLKYFLLLQNTPQ